MNHTKPKLTTNGNNKMSKDMCNMNSRFVLYPYQNLKSQPELMLPLLCWSMYAWHSEPNVDVGYLFIQDK